MNKTTYFITGASDGLGEALAKLLLKNGDAVVGLSRTRPALDIEWIPLDLTNGESVSAAADQILASAKSAGGGLSMINCAGVHSYEAARPTWDELERVFRTHAIGPILLEYKLIDWIKKVAGEIVNVTSTNCHRAAPGEMFYGASKWSIRGFTKTLSEIFKGTKARAVEFCPGGFYTKIGAKVGDPIADPADWMPLDDVAETLFGVIKTPRTMEISEIVVNRKTRNRR
ncbi:MAG: SDR family oxidoreductase [Candidatus Nomurabacteria bacterium]|jgi:3-hydroxy acid dehydrogenase/malonic semialdehyde reductase|nr:SDR family oxidoreductase [Candidatus Nomurabacteria bacterium]